MNEESLYGSRSSPLIYSKVYIPRSSNLLSRTRLLDFLHENIHRKLLLICAGPGYGKTSLLVDFAQSTDLPVCWYTLDPSDRDPRILLDYIVESLRVRFPSFGERTRTLLQRGGGSIADLRGIVGVLVNELSEQIPEYVVIVLDDYHTVDLVEEINQITDTLIQYLPENTHLIISGRSIPPLSLTRLVAYGEAAAIGADHLRFTVEEVSTLLQQNFDLDLSEQDSRALVEESEGWITGILLRAQAGRQEAMGILAQAKPPQDHVYTYLAEEILRRLAPDVQEFLKAASVPRQLDAAFCDALMERHDSAQILSFLERRNLFLVPLEGGWYRFHGLFREFLLDEARAEWAKFSRLNQRAAWLWREQGELGEAIEHLLQAQAYEEAANEIEDIAQELFEQSRFQTLVRWIATLPEVVCQKSPQLLLYQGKTYIAIGEGGKARTSFLQAEQLFAQSGSLKGWVQTLADRAVLERMQGAYHEALQTAREGLLQGRELESPAIVDLHRSIGVCLHTLGDIAGAEEHSRMAVELSQGTGLYSQALAYLDLGFCLYTQGRLEQADAAYRQALERSRTIGSPDLQANILNNLAMGPFFRGEFQEARDLLLQALEAAQTSLSPRIQALVQASLGDVYRDIGEPNRARQSYREGLEQARLAHSADLVTYILEALGNLARQQNAPAEAFQYLRDALDAASSSQRDATRVQVSLAMLHAVEGRRTEALNLIEEAILLQEEAGWGLELVRSWLAQAITLYHSGRNNDAQTSVLQAAALAEKMGVLEPFLAEGGALLPLLRQLPAARRGSTLERVFARLQDRRVDRASEAPLMSPQPLLHIAALGTGRVFQGGREIQTKDWGYRLARELFFYLLFNTPTRRGQIALSFWPERNAARVSSVFHATLYRARRAIGYPFVIFQEDTYLWNPDLSYWCDVIEFECLLNQVESLPPGDPQSIALVEQAISLYQGDFLAEFDREWCIIRREELSMRYLQALLLLGNLYLEQQNISDAQEAYQKAIQVDSFAEEAYRGLMRCHALAGERASVIRIYQQCCHSLGHELGIEPSEETKTLYRALVQEEIQAQNLD